MTKTIKRSLVYIGIATIVLACGGALLAPLWERNYEGQAAIAITPAIDGQSVYVSQHFSDKSLHIEQVDLAGNTTRTLGFLDVAGYLNPVALSERALLMLNPLANAEDSVYIDLDAATIRPAFPAEFTGTLARFNISNYFVQDDGDLVFKAYVVFSGTVGEVAILGHLQAAGLFSYVALPEHVTAVNLKKMGNSTGYVVSGSYPSDYALASGMQSFIKFLDADLNIITERDLDRNFTLSAGFNDRAYGYFSQDNIIQRYAFFDVDGNELADQAGFADRKFIGGKDYFYTYLNSVNTDQELCRYDYTLQPLNCFVIPNLGFTDVFTVLADDSIGISQHRITDLVIGLNISIAQFDGALLGSGSFRGIYEVRYHHRTFSPEGKLILNAQAKPFIERGHMAWCGDWFGTNITCLEPETFTPGVCELSGAVYLNQSQLISAQRWCESDTIGNPQLSMWQR